MSVNVKPLTHWIIYKGYRVRFTQRTPYQVSGVLTTPAGELEFSYQPMTQVITLPDVMITINDYGWEIEKASTHE